MVQIRPREPNAGVAKAVYATILKIVARIGVKVRVLSPAPVQD